jgi:predicted  nucleic acid-binding Zn-ribbon protein
VARLLAADESALYSFCMEDAFETLGETSPRVCGRCGQRIDVTGTVPAQCPHCGGEVVEGTGAEPQQPAENQIDVDAENDSAAEFPSAEEDELNSLHIRQVAALRQSANRSRSHCVVIATALLVGAGKLALMTIQNVRSGGQRIFSAGYLFAIALALIFSWKLIGRIVALTRELKQPLLSDPLEPPDFSTLSDGSQHARHLAEMQGQPRDPE